MQFSDQIASSNTPPPLPSNLVAWLDFIRAISAQLVLLAHLEILRVFEQFPFYLPPLGSIAVVLFFVLSGFLITRTIIIRYQDDRHDFCAFLIDRLCRIYPAYLAALLLVAVIDYYHILYSPKHYESFLNGLDQLSYTWPNFIGTALMCFKAPHLGDLVGYSNTLIFGSARQFWTLPIEWWIYLTIGYISLTLKQNRFRFADYMITLSLGYIPFFFLFQGNPTTGAGIAAIWLMGGIASLVYHFVSLDMSKSYLARMVAMGTGLLGTTTFFRYQIAQNPFDMLGAFNLAGFFLLSLWLVEHPNSQFLRSKRTQTANRFLSSFAYSLYLTHYSLIGLFQTLELPTWIQWGLCNLTAYLFAVVFEKPHRRWARRLHGWRNKRMTSMTR